MGVVGVYVVVDVVNDFVVDVVNDIVVDVVSSDVDFEIVIAVSMESQFI